MKKLIWIGMVLSLLSACKKDPVPSGTAKPFVSKMIKKDGNVVETYEFIYNSDHQITTVNNRDFTITVQYNDQKKVKHIEKIYTQNRWNIVADYTYDGEHISREQKFEQLPPDPAFGYSYTYDMGINNKPVQLHYFNSNNTNAYSATLTYGANQNPASIVSAGGQRTEYEYSEKAFSLFPGNAFIYPWLDIFLTHEYGYYIPFTKELTKVKRTTGSGWQIDLHYTYNPEGRVARLLWQQEHNIPSPPHIIEYSFEYGQ